MLMTMMVVYKAAHAYCRDEEMDGCDEGRRECRQGRKNRTALHARGYRRSSVSLNLALSRSDRGRERKRGSERERERVGALRSACSRILTQIVGFVRRARVRQERMELSGV